MEESNQKKAWLNKMALESLYIEAKDKYPLETGGILMGYFGESGNIPVIMYASGPGPNAIHLRNYYRPDQEFDEAIIAAIHRKSGRQITYLGDWHTHPAPIDKLSYKDKKTLKKIAMYKNARVNMPLMLILSYDNQWAETVWQAELHKAFIGYNLITCTKLTTQQF